MDPLFFLALLLVLCSVITVFIVKMIDRTRCKPFANRKLMLQSAIKDLEKQTSNLQAAYDALDAETKDLQDLRGKSDELTTSLQSQTEQLKAIKAKIDSVKDLEREADEQIHAIQSKVDLYSRIDDFVDYGMYEKPEYIYETAERFALEIRKVREAQKSMIQNQKVLIADDETYEFDASFMKRVVTEQKKLLIRSFNIECDLLIAKVNSGNIERTLERIDAVATSLEKSAADLRYGFNIDYIELKYQECTLQYQAALKKKEEQDEQRALKEQMREEERARREYEQAIAAAQKEEDMYLRMLEKARESLMQASDEERQAAELRIQQLEAELAEAKVKAERAISMAEQTKKGHIYVVSNIGSFGEGVYKIGMTRRLEPTERVKELGDASVPFSFDIHAMISCDNAPALENALHKAFDAQRVNAVNLRKEFFKVSLESIKQKTDELIGKEADFVMTVLAEEYFQSKRMRQSA